MGNFVGHVLPGSLFIIFSILWSINLLRFYFQVVKRKSGQTDELCFECKHITKPLESLILLIVLPIAIAGEYFTGFQDSPDYICSDNLQHMTMYMFFFILSIANLLEAYAMTPIPSIIDPLYGFAFGVETLLLYFHIHGQGPVEQHLHKLLTFAAFMCALSSFLAGIFKRDVVVQLAKPLFVLLQCTWFIQIAFLIYPASFSLHNPMKNPHSSHQSSNSTLETHSENHHHQHHEDDHRSIMITTAYFCWHFAFCLVTIFSLVFVCRRKFYKPKLFLSPKYQRLLETSTHDQEMVN